MTDYQIKLEQFEGPLTLLLELIEKEKLDISNISLAKVTDQCISYLEKENFSDPRLLADFLVVVAKLILIKSRIFIPFLEDVVSEDDSGISLEKQLKIFRVYYLAAKRIGKIVAEKHFSFARETPLIVQGFYPPRGINKEILARTFKEIIAQIEPLIKIPQKTLEKLVSFQEKIKEIKEIISQKKVVGFSHLIKSDSSSEIIVAFLAILELAKEKTINLFQEDLFAEIKISFYGEEKYS